MSELKDIFPDGFIVEGPMLTPFNSDGEYILSASVRSLPKWKAEQDTMTKYAPKMLEMLKVLLIDAAHSPLYEGQSFLTDIHKRHIEDIRALVAEVTAKVDSEK